MIITAQEAIDQALGLIGVYSTGTTITPNEYHDCLRTMNLMLDRWNLSDLLIFSTNPHTFAFVPGQQTYTLGDNGDFDMPRPSSIERMSVQYPSNSSTPMELGIDANYDLESWQALVVKNVPSQFPLCCWNNTGFPYMELNFWPIPQGPCNVILYTWDLLPELADLSDSISLPPGYADAIIYNLAPRLASLFDRIPTPELLQEARQAKHDLNKINNQTPTLHLDNMYNGSGNSLAAQSWGRVVL